MSEFFDFIGDYTPVIVWWFVWACIAPIRLGLLIALPFNADRRYNWAYPVYQFLAFDRG
jgi:hypothetical protein